MAPFGSLIQSAAVVSNRIGQSRAAEFDQGAAGDGARDDLPRATFEKK
jgi:hypothetical protein